MYKVFLDGISDNMSSLLKLGRYGAINAADSTTMVYYVIKCLSEPYKIQEEQTTYGQVSKEGEFVVKDECLRMMR